MKFQLLRFPISVTTLTVLALFGSSCSSSSASKLTEPDDASTGTLAMALRAEGGFHLTSGTIEIYEAGETDNPEKEITVQAEEDTYDVTLLPGDYTASVIDFDCGYDGTDPDIVGTELVYCTFDGFRELPSGTLDDPFEIEAGETTDVALQFTFYFERDIEAIVVFGVGFTEISMVAASEVTEPCGDTGAQCSDSYMCANPEGDDNEGCYKKCTVDTDCEDIEDTECIPVSLSDENPSVVTSLCLVP